MPANGKWDLIRRLKVKSDIVHMTANASSFSLIVLLRKLFFCWHSEFSQEMPYLSTCRLNIRKTFSRPVPLSHQCLRLRPVKHFYSILQLNNIPDNSESVAISKSKFSMSPVLTEFQYPYLLSLAFYL